jgi:CRP-like cAMP-binding protein
VNVDKGKTLLKVIDKIPMFSGLGMENARLVLQLCEFRSTESGQVLCKVGEPSSEMLILLSGRLGVYNAEQVQLATIEPAAPVGEMGLITGQPRSATVRVIAPANLLVLKKVAFDRLMRSNGTICSKVYRNVIQTLAGRLVDSQRQQRVVEQECAERENDLLDLEAQIRAMQGEG